MERVNPPFLPFILTCLSPYDVRLCLLFRHPMFLLSSTSLCSPPSFPPLPPRSLSSFTFSFHCSVPALIFFHYFIPFFTSPSLSLSPSRSLSLSPSWSANSPTACSFLSSASKTRSKVQSWWCRLATAGEGTQTERSQTDLRISTGF